jgi:excisionase family DNA binding protein
MTKRIPQTQKPIPQGPFLSVREAGDLLRIAKQSIHRYIRLGKLKKFKVGSRTLIRRDDVLALVREG